MKILVLTLTIFSSIAFGKTVYFGSETETLTLSYGSPSLFRFPTEVRTITGASRFEIKPANGDSPNYSVLAVRPRFTSGSSQITFMLNDGSLVRTKLSVISGNRDADGVFDFKAKESLLPDSSGGDRTSNLSDLELMKAVIRDGDVSGYSITRPAQTITPGFRGVETVLVKKYSGRFNAFVFEIKNVTKNRLFINIQNLMLGDPNLAILSSVDSPVLEARGKDGAKTYLRIVAKSTSSYAKLVLPVQIVENGAKQ